MSSEGKIMSLRRMASHLGVPSKWLREQAELGKIPGLRAGDRWLFAPDVAFTAVRAMAGATATPSNTETEIEVKNDN